MLKCLPFIVPFFFLMGCLSSQEERLPIAEDKLGEVLIDVHVAESAMVQLQNGPKKDSLADLYYNQISAIHQVDRETLDTCLAIMERNPEMMERIYEKISEEVDKMAATNSPFH